LRPLAVDVAGRQLEAAGIVARLEDGREVVVDLVDIRKALAVEPVNPKETLGFPEAAKCSTTTPSTLPNCGSRGRCSSGRRPMKFSRMRLSEARAVLAYSPAMASDVPAGTLSLDEALHGSIELRAAATVNPTNPW
jgi:hypothetical protein